MRNEHLKYIQELFQEYLVEGKLKDAACTVLSKEGTVQTEYLGDYDENTIYRLFSMTKPVTACALYLLVERGKLTLSQPVSDFLPCFREQKVWNGKMCVPMEREVQLRDLADMVSGLAYPGDGTYSGEIMGKKISVLTERYDRGGAVKKEEILRAIAETPLLFQPGTEWHYGISADILGAVIETVSGKDLDDFFREELFEPLEMKHTGFKITEQDVKHLACIYTRSNGQLHPISEKRMKELFLREPWKQPPFLAAGSGLYATMEDYCHLVQMLLNRGCYRGRRILSEASVRAMELPALDKRQKASIYFDGMEGYNYGSLLRHLEEVPPTGGIGALGEYGWDGLLGNDFFVCPSRGLACVYFQQISEGADYTFRRKFRQIIYAAWEGADTEWM